ncbi:hypothetical protein FQR65_LT04264 [Abscondita terminalis]|nr:hypothetical protein FQR65_LT04264 [Abscondita terminalis]
MNFHEGVYPVSQILKIMGISTIHFNNVKNKYEVPKRNIMQILAAAFLLPTALALLIEFTEVASDDSEYSLSETKFWFDLYSGVCLHTISIAIHGVTVKKQCKILNNMIKIDNVLNAIGEETSYKNVFLYCCVGIFLAVLQFFVVLISDIYLMNNYYSILFMISCDLPVMTTGLIKLEFLLMHKIFLKLFRSINKVLKECKNLMKYKKLFKRDIARNSSFLLIKQENHYVQLPVVFENINSVRNSYLATWHFHLRQRNCSKENTHHSRNLQLICKTYQLLHLVFGVPLLIILFVALYTSIDELYYCYELISRRERDYLWNVYVSVQWTICQHIEVFLLIKSCHKIYDENRKVGYSINSVMIETTNEDVVYELKEFLLHLSHVDVRFTACKFFALNYELLLKMYGTIASYLVIMIQLDLARNV